jgi:hypothetical protein
MPDARAAAREVYNGDGGWHVPGMKDVNQRYCEGTIPQITNSNIVYL